MKTILELRLEKYYTQEEVMKKARILSRSHYSKIENRHLQPGLKLKRRLAKVLDVSPNEIYW